MRKEMETEMKSHQAFLETNGGESESYLFVTSGSVQDEQELCFTMEEAVALCDNLGKFIKIEALRRQNLLKEQLQDLKAKERSVFHEVSEINGTFMDVPKMSVKLISMYCPKKK